MSELSIGTYAMPAADLGPPNPLPKLITPNDISPPVKVQENVPISARRYLGYGCDTGTLPYLVQDNYDRNPICRQFKVAVLENEFLRATFLLDFGGRLWSLWHKPRSRELLFCNPVFQPGNLAVRNAWFAGGVEWNASIQGHTPLSCSPVFAARVEANDGTPVLRLYEWDRIRGVPYQLDFWLPDGSPWLLLRARLTNPHHKTIPMYWWSNIAVPETPETRVLAPADAAYNFGYSGEMKHITIPRDSDSPDVTYATNARGSADYFYDIQANQRKWIAALDGDGKGLVQTSTPQQHGRKLFVWGMSQGGRRWQQFLTTSGHAYMEIQAGVAPTQFECFPLEPQSELAWTEAYGLMEADPAAVHGENWHMARQAVESRLEKSFPESKLDLFDLDGRKFSDRAPVELLHRGSGWGALGITPPDPRKRTIVLFERIDL